MAYFGHDGKVAIFGISGFLRAVLAMIEKWSARHIWCFFLVVWFMECFFNVPRDIFLVIFVLKFLP